MLNPKHLHLAGRLTAPVVKGGKAYFAAERDPSTGRTILPQAMYTPQVENPLNAASPSKYSVWNIEAEARKGCPGNNFGSDHQFASGLLVYTSMPRMEELATDQSAYYNSTSELDLTTLVEARRQQRFLEGWRALEEKQAEATWVKFLASGLFKSSTSGGKVTSKDFTAKAHSLSNANTNVSVQSIFGEDTDFVHWYPIVAAKGINLFVEIEPVASKKEAPSNLSACFMEENSYEQTYKRILDGECNAWIDGLAHSIGQGMLTYAFYRQAHAKKPVRGGKLETSLPALPTICIKFGSEMSLPAQAYGISMTQYAKEANGKWKMIDGKPEIVASGGYLLPSMEKKAEGYRRAYEYVARRFRTRLAAIATTVKNFQLIAPEIGFDPLAQLKFAWCPQNYSPFYKVELDENNNVLSAKSANGGQFINKFIIDKLFPKFVLGPLEKAGEIEYVGFDAYSQYGRSVQPRFYVDDGKLVDARFQYRKLNTVNVLAVFEDQKWNNLFQKSNTEVAAEIDKLGKPLSQVLVKEDFVDLPNKTSRYAWGGVEGGVGPGCYSVHTRSELGVSANSWLLPEHCFGISLYGLYKYFGNTKRFLIGETNCYVVPKCMHEDQLIGRLYSQLYPTSNKVKSKTLSNRDVLQALFSRPNFVPSVGTEQEYINDSEPASRAVSAQDVTDYYDHQAVWYSKSFWARRASEYLRLWAELRDISISMSWFFSADQGPWMLTVSNIFKQIDTLPKEPDNNKSAAFESQYPKFSSAIRQQYIDKSLSTSDVIAFYTKAAEDLIGKPDTKGRSYRFDTSGMQVYGTNGNLTDVAGASPTENSAVMWSAFMDALVAGDLFAEAAQAAEEKIVKGPISGFVVSKDTKSPGVPIYGYLWATTDNVTQAMTHYLINVPPSSSSVPALQASMITLPPSRTKYGYIDP